LKSPLARSKLRKKISRFKLLADFVQTTPSKYYCNAIIPSQLSNFVTYREGTIFVKIMGSLDDFLRLCDLKLRDLANLWSVKLIRMQKNFIDIKYDVILVTSSNCVT